MSLYTTLPKALPPRRIGNETVGIIEVPVRGGLTVEESDLLAELESGRESIVIKVSKLAQRIEAETNGVTDVEAYRVIEDSVFGRKMKDEAQALAIRYAQEIEVIRQYFLRLTRADARDAVTVIMRCRLGQDGIPPDLHRVHYKGILGLFNDEVAAEDTKPAPMTSEKIKKQQPATAKSPPTGAASSGN